jgi:hypothetical protein
MKKTEQVPIVNYWNEKWERIDFPEFDNQIHYEISNYGRIKSFQNTDEGVLIHGSLIQGYQSLNVRFQNKSVNHYIHKLVAKHFCQQNSPKDTFVIHLDFNKQDNRADNLQWADRSKVTEHNKNNPSVINRLIPLRTKNYKLTEGKVMLIKQMLRSDKSRLKMIAKQFGITHTQLNRIRSGENWKQVKLADEV